MKKAIATQEYQDLINWLISARIAMGWDMRDLAASLDVPHTVVHKVERLQRRLDIYEYVAYCRALKLNPSTGLQFFADPPNCKK